MTALLVALGAGVGAPVRWWLAQRLDGDWPLGTWSVNVVGSFVLGLCAGLAVTGDTLALVGTGFCGGLTTYSSFAVQTREAGRHAPAYVAATLGGALLACWLGFVLAA
ncbi:MAG: fluoride efflux transporter CrcB [Actinobacteria bacterium]|uniref:Unannotated protein n=1 Tax=freshwater metagenome TaxID=449393 RepID=A0A6J6QMU1_9ZZZZ|nr:fluoride efflux transporter CrcB [Actinomycetota bacterium]